MSSFWLSNAYELICIVKNAQDREIRYRQKQTAASASRANLFDNEAERALERIHAEIDFLIIELYMGWNKELRKRLQNMIVPAVIENQSLPGYICKQGGGLWGKWGKSATNPQFTIEHLLNVLSKLSKTMRSYYMEDSMTRQILTELLRVIGVAAFNHLLMRKNFCTWKRGMLLFGIERLIC